MTLWRGSISDRPRNNQAPSVLHPYHIMYINDKSSSMAPNTGSPFKRLQSVSDELPW